MLNKILSFISLFAILFLQIAAPLQVLAQEASSSPEVIQSPSPTPTPSASPEVSPSPSETPVPTETAVSSESPSPTPAETLSPTPSPAPPSDQNNSGTTVDETGQANAPPSASPSPTSTPSANPSNETGTPDAHLTVTVLENTDAETIPVLDLDPSNIESSATLTTDKPDYAPTDTAIISGTGLTPNTTYILTVSSADDPATSTTENVTADENGTFIYAYQLDGTYRPNYKVELKDSSGVVVATIAFTDTVNNTPPSFDPIIDRTINEDSSTQDVPITNVSPGPVDESDQTVTFTATSSNPSLIPNPTVSGVGATRTLAYTPVTNANGTATITVIADDGQVQNNTFPRTFTITVVALGSISGNKYEDKTGNPGLSGWTINLSGDSSAAATTDSSGNYSFSQLAPGTYQVCEVLQSGWVQTAPSSGYDCGSNILGYEVELSAGQNLTGQNFANFNYGQISGKKYEDVNENGEDDNGEPGLSGWTIYIDANNNSQYDLWENEQSITTDSEGRYTFSNLGPGTYIVREEVQAGWRQTDPTSADSSLGGQDDKSYVVIMTSNGNKTQRNFGNFHLGTISGQKFDDTNGDGMWDWDEWGLEDWTIFLDANNNGELDCDIFNDDGSCGFGETSTTTDMDGYYEFSGLTAGTYKVREATQSGWTQTTTNPSDITVTSGTSGTNVPGVDFGNFPWTIITGLKWKDLNANGQLDEGEPGIGGWDMSLSSVDTIITSRINQDGGAPIMTEIISLSLVSTTPTTVNGQVSFEVDKPGTYRLTEDETKDNFQRTYPVDSFFDITVSVGGQNITTDKNGNPLEFGNAPVTQVQGATFVPTSGDGSATTSIVVLGDSIISVASGEGTSTVSLPDGTVITRSDGDTIDSSLLSAQDVSTLSLSGLGTGVAVDGALQWGIPDLGLEFSQAITLNIFVGTSLNGQTLNVVRSSSGTGAWTSDGIVAPATCVVSAGICTFQATKASYYATTHTVSTTTTGATQATTDPTGPFPAPSCNDTKPGSAPALLSAAGGTNSVTLTWSRAANPVTYYLATYGLSSGAQQYGNPNVGGPDTTSYTVGGLSGGTTYYFKVRAGNGCAPGDFSNELSATPTGAFVEGPAAGFAPGVLGTTSEQENVGVGEVKGETTPSAAEPSITFQPQTAEQSPFNAKVILVIVVALLLGFGVFKLIIK